MSVTRTRLFAAAVILSILAAAPALAAGPFGVGLPEPAPSGGGFLPGLFRAIAAWQSSFYKDLTATIHAMKSDGSAGIWLCFLSFAYGVLHAAGPGHGKAIVTAYVLANRETARNGAILALVSAFAQGVTAVALVSIAGILLGATSIAMTDAARFFEIGSFALVTGLGAWLVWRKILQPLAASYATRYAPVTVGGAIVESHGHDHHDHDHGHHHHHHHHDEACDCGHMPSPELAAGPLDWKKALSTIVAVGMRPCTGALIVLVFALSQGIYIAGIAAAFAMALGTGITVAILALLAVSARSLALRLSGGGNSRLGHDMHMAIEGFGALLVLSFGLLMLGASLVSQA